MDPQKAGKRKGVTVKTLKKVLKKAGKKTTGKKATLTRRAKKYRLLKGGGDIACDNPGGGPMHCAPCSDSEQPVRASDWGMKC